MKLLLIVDAFWGGAGNVMQILAGELSRRGHDCTLLLLNGAMIAPRHDLTGVRVIEYPLVEKEPAKTPVGRLWRYKNAVRHLIEEAGPEAILSFLTEYNGLTAWSVGGKYPLVISERNNPFQDVQKPQWMLLRKLFYQKANRLVVQCAQFGDYFPKLRDKGKIRVIPNPILTPDLQYSPRPDDSVRLVSLGRLEPQKNLPWMIEAVCRIHAVNPACTLTVYGTGTEQERLRLLTAENNADGFITLAGKTDASHRVLSQSDIFLLTSDYEGFPNALSEAMAVGLPSVSRTCHEGLRDLVEDGVNGYLTAPDDMDAFVSRVLTLAADRTLRANIGLAARGVTERYCISRIVDAWERVLCEAVESHKENISK